MSTYGLTLPEAVTRASRGTRPPIVAGDVVGEVPHADEWWISTDDVLDYAHWLNIRVDQTAEAAGANVLALAPAPTQTGQTQLPPLTDAQRAAFDSFARWRSDTWKPFLAALEGSFWARVNAWNDVRARHNDLIALRDELYRVGLGPLPPLDGLPEEVPWYRDVARAIGEPLKETQRTADSIALAAGIAIGGYLLLESRRGR
jgi:hypothetical protein